MNTATLNVDREYRLYGALVEWRRETGRPLPLPIDEIVAHELAGRNVDLITGAVSEAPPEEGVTKVVA